MSKLMIEKYKDKLLELGLIMPKEDEQKYCKENLLELRRLDNGCRIVSAQRIMSDSRDTSINFQILSGSYSDPKGKEGIHHFMEHLLFNRELHSIHDKNLVSSNASTSPQKIRFMLDGFFNTEYLDFGLMPILEKSIGTLIHPLGLNNKDYFENTKSVIFREIEEYESDAKRQAFRKLYELTLDKVNSDLAVTLGTKESLAGISIDDVKKLADERIVASNIIASHLCIGNGKESSILTDKMADIMSQFPRTGELNEYDPFETDKIKELEGNTLTKKNVPIKNGMVAVIAIRILEIEPYTTEYHAFKNYLAKHLRNEFFIEAREAGLGYSVDLFTQTFLPNKAILGVLSMCRTEDYERTLHLLNQVVDTVLKETEKDKQALLSILEIEKNRQLVNPISQDAKLDFALYYLNTFDMIGDVKADRAIKLRVSLDDIYTVYEKINKSDTQVFVIGDIEE